MSTASKYIKISIFLDSQSIKIDFSKNQCRRKIFEIPLFRPKTSRKLKVKDCLFRFRSLYDLTKSTHGKVHKWFLVSRCR